MEEQLLLDDLAWLEKHIELLDPQVVIARLRYEALQKQFNNFSNERTALIIKLMEVRHGQSNN